MPLPHELEHDSELDDARIEKKGKPKRAQNKGTPRDVKNKGNALKGVMKAQAEPKKKPKYPWGDEWIHPDNPALYEGDTDEDGDVNSNCTVSGEVRIF